MTFLPAHNEWKHPIINFPFDFVLQSKKLLNNSEKNRAVTYVFFRCELDSFGILVYGVRVRGVQRGEEVFASGFGPNGALVSGALRVGTVFVRRFGIL